MHLKGINIIFFFFNFYYYHCLKNYLQRYPTHHITYTTRTTYNIASYADVLRLVGGTRDKPKNVCVGGYLQHSTILRFLSLLHTLYEKLKIIKKRKKKQKERERTTYYICTLVTYNSKTKVTKILVLVDLLTFKPLK